MDIPYSPFRKLMPYADKAKSRNIHVYHLNIGQPDIVTPPKALEHFYNAPIELLAYSPGVGKRVLREQIAEYQAKLGIQIHPDQIIVNSGASEAIYFVLLACLEYGDEVIIPEPFYANYNGFAHMAGVQIRPITCHIDDHFKLPEIEAFARCISDRTKAIMITNPNNPTGCVYSKEKIEQLAHLSKQMGLFLIVDEVYRDFCYTDAPFYSALEIKGVEDHVIVVDSVSKKYSMCGARLGFTYTKNEPLYQAIERLAKLRLSPPGLSEELVSGILGDDADYMRDARHQYDVRRQTVYDRLSHMNGVECYLPEGAFYCFAKFPIEDSEHFCKWLLEDFSHRGETVMLSPASGFYATPGLGHQEVRIASVLAVDKLERAMDCLEEGLRQYTRKYQIAQMEH